MLVRNVPAPSSPLRRLGYCLLPLVLGMGAALVLLLAASGPTRPALASNLTYPGVCGATIQTCIDGANPGDTILISAGDYTESLTLSKAVSLTGALSSTTLLHALPNTRVLTVTGAAVDSSVVISGLTFTGGVVTGTAFCPESCGGGILITDQANPHLINALLSHNTAGSAGGGLFDYAGLSMSGMRFIDNSGGGAYVQGPTTVQDSLFQGNHAESAASGAGGGLTVFSGNLTLTNTQFISNSAIASGGGAVAFGAFTVRVQGGMFQGNQCGPFCAGGGLYAQDTLVLTGTRFISNTSGTSGGGVYADNGVLRNTLFESNRCTRLPCFGGGLYGSGSYSAPLLTLIDTQFMSNSATFSGGGYEADGQTMLRGVLFQGNLVNGSTGYGGGLVAGAALTVTNTFFVENHSNGYGGGLAIRTFAAVRVVNSLFARNGAGAAGDALASAIPGSTTLLHSTIAGPALGSGAAIVVTTGTLGITDTIISSYTTGISLTAGSVFENYNLFSGLAVTTTGSIGHGGHSLTGNPAFRNPAAGDYHLTAGSAALNTGIDAGVTTDFEGDHRPSGTGFDIGFDEVAVFRLLLPLLRR